MFFADAGSPYKPLEFGCGPSSPAGCGDGIALVNCITLIVVILAAPWHPEMQLVVRTFDVYRDIWLSASDLRLLKRHLEAQKVKKKSIVNIRHFRADDLSRRGVLCQLDLTLDSGKSVLIHPLLAALRWCVPGIHQEYIRVCNAR